jgi:16S rRNA (guanine527-N7)-methyltransferase
MSSIDIEKSISDKIARELSAAGLPALDPAQLTGFDAYLKLILRWNARTNLTAIRDEDSIIRRHFVESIACALALPQGITTLLDFGSGAGFPGIPISLCRAEIQVTLAESQNKKSAFLQEAVRVLGLSARVFSGRAETIQTQVDCVTLRAVDKMQNAIATAARLVRPGGWLAALTTATHVAGVRAAACDGFGWQEPVHLPGSEKRVLALGEKKTRP